MNKKVYLHIPEPCHEDWNAMTPAQQGRYCQSCCKTVTDFSNMSDKQILEVLSKAAGNSCGRFNSEQLTRAIQPEITPVIKPYKFFLSAFIPAFLFGGKAFSQGKVKMENKTTCTTTVASERIMGDTIVMPSTKRVITGQVLDNSRNPLVGAKVGIENGKIAVTTDAKGNFSIELPANVKKPVLEVNYIGYESKKITVSALNNLPLTMVLNAAVLGEVAVVGGYWSDEVDEEPLSRNVVIKGSVTDEDGNPLPNASISYKGLPAKGFTTDQKGHFKLKMKREEGEVDIVVSYVGYEKSEKHLSFSDNRQQQVAIVLKPDVVLDEVIVASYQTSCKRTMIAGGISMVSSYSFTDTVKTHIAKVLGKNLFKIYPNPVAKSQSVSLAFKNAGHYTIQLFDNNGRLYLQKEIDIDGDSQSYSLEMPASLTSGKYYIKAISAKTKKQFTDKLIVQ